MTDVDSNDRHSKCCYKYGNVEIRTPVLYDDARGYKVVGEDNRVFEKVIPTCGVP